ncbi:TPA: Gfo/Idh/MocA family oxidoreductase [Aeromonas sobria]|nr:Gfo/Idh/MocA family oxidoreductase [Aeromonas sobria]
MSTSAMTMRPAYRPRIIVLGAGHMGKKHIDTILAMPELELTGIYDPASFNELKLPETCYALHQQSAQALPQMLASADLAVLACPTRFHFSMAMMAVEAGLHCLIEKPVSEHIQDALQLQQSSALKDIRIAVGQVERFNPAILAARQLIEQHSWQQVRLSRLNPASQRLATDSLVSDLMVHDIDIAFNVFNLMPQHGLQVSASSMQSGTPDYVVANYRTANGMSVEISASRLPGPALRAIVATGEAGELSIDLLRRRCDFTPKDGQHSHISSWGHSNALKVQMQSFVQYALHRQPGPLATLAEALQVLTCCKQIETQAVFALKQYQTAHHPA